MGVKMNFLNLCSHYKSKITKPLDVFFRNAVGSPTGGEKLNLISTAKFFRDGHAKNSLCGLNVLDKSSANPEEPS